MQHAGNVIAVQYGVCHDRLAPRHRRSGSMEVGPRVVNCTGGGSDKPRCKNCNKLCNLRMSQS